MTNQTKALIIVIISVVTTSFVVKTDIPLTDLITGTVLGSLISLWIKD